MTCSLVALVVYTLALLAVGLLIGALTTFLVFGEAAEEIRKEMDEGGHE